VLRPTARRPLHQLDAAAALANTLRSNGSLAVG
jgi:hypothetical protein